jgi:hypothetical protein
MITGRPTRIGVIGKIMTLCNYVCTTPQENLYCILTHVIITTIAVLISILYRRKLNHKKWNKLPRCEARIWTQATLFQSPSSSHHTTQPNASSVGWLKVSYRSGRNCWAVASGQWGQRESTRHPYLSLQKSSWFLKSGAKKCFPG